MKDDTEYFSKFFMQKQWEDLELSQQAISFFFFLSWGVIALQYCVSFCYTVK